MNILNVFSDILTIFYNFADNFKRDILSGFLRINQVD